jgi:hypothetical protein
MSNPPCAAYIHWGILALLGISRLHPFTVSLLLVPGSDSPTQFYTIHFNIILLPMNNDIACTITMLRTKQLRERGSIPGTDKRFFLSPERLHLL